MSKIGTIRLELDEQAGELGFESYEQAKDAGCEIEWIKDRVRLVDPLTAAHEAWAKEKEEVLEELRELVSAYQGSLAVTAPAEHAIKFILNGER